MDPLSDLTADWPGMTHPLPVATQPLSRSPGQEQEEDNVLLNDHLQHSIRWVQQELEIR